MKKLNIKISENAKKYDILISSNLLNKSEELILNVINPNKILIVTDENVNNLYGETLKKSFTKKIVEFLVLKAGEETKSLEKLNLIWKKALELRLERKDAIVAFGGGVIGDLAGFAAASYLRGIDFIQIPTSLLAQVDSSVGGKVAIDLEEGKNLVGAFYQPKLVIADTSLLSTLPEKELKTGLAEVIKYGFIEKNCPDVKFKNFLNELSDNKDKILEKNPEILSKIVEYSCILKSKVVEHDEKENGLRTILNLGHTIGHAIEKTTEYKVFTHGEAVAMGIKAVFFISQKMGLIKDDYYNQAVGILEKFALNYSLSKDISIEKIKDALLSDKKVLSGKVRFVLPTNFGEVKIFDDVKEDLIEKAILMLE